MEQQDGGSHEKGTESPSLDLNGLATELRNLNNDLIPFLSSKEELQDLVLIQSHRLLIIEFFSENCLLCCMIKKRLEELQKKYLNCVSFYRVDVQALPDLANEAGISGLPTFHFFLNKQLLHSMSGGDPFKLQTLIDQVLQSMNTLQQPTSVVSLRWSQVSLEGQAPVFPAYSAFCFGTSVLVLPQRGSSSSAPFLVQPFIYTFDMNAMKWRTHACSGSIPPAPATACVCIGRQIFYFCLEYHESTGIFDCTQLYILNIDSLTWTKPCVSGTLPVSCHDGRVGYSLCAIGNCIYLFGGGCEDVDDRFDDLYALKIDSFCWERIKPRGLVPVARGKHSMISVGNSLLLFGGEACGQDNFYEFNEVHVFNTETNTWKEMPAKGIHPLPRVKHAVVTTNQKMFILGGEHDFHIIPQFDVAVLNLETQTWERVEVEGQIPLGRINHAAVLVNNIYNNTIIILGGEDDEENNLILEGVYVVNIPS